MLVTDLRHFLDLPDSAPGPSHRLAEYLSGIVRAATSGAATTSWETALPCRRRPGRRRCPGRIIVTLPDPQTPIRWRCSCCGDDGAIGNWAGSVFDLRRKQLAPLGDVNAITVSHQVAAALRELQFLDPDCERLVFAIRANDDRAVLAATADDLEQLIDALAAEANHEPNRTRQRRLDVAFETLNREPR